MINNYIGERDTVSFSIVINKLREFFLSKGCIEVHTQDRLSILAACEDPDTVSTYGYVGELWPLPQTGQMWLEYEILTKPDISGVFCVSTSYRAEPNPIPGRHKIIFPMFEFEMKGTLEDLRNTEAELLKHLGFDSKMFVYKSYDDMAEKYDVKELSSVEESKMAQDFGQVVFLEEFPVSTSPFWNMKKKNSEYSHKIDVILSGQETIGSAERSTDKDEMKKEFYSISDGKYSQKLFDLFSKERVEKELEEYLSLDFFPRYGAGIGVSRLIKAMKENGLL